MFSTGEVYQLAPDHPLDITGLRRTLSQYRVVTFNGLGYDFPIIALALAGADNATLKHASDQIIVHQARPWDITRDSLEWCDHVDLMAVKPGDGGLKMLMAKMHAKKLQDLPIDPSASIAWYQRVLLHEYCRNDLAGTQQLLDTFPAQLRLREEMSVEYGIDLRSKSDAQIAEAVMKSLLPFKVERPHIPAGTQFHYRPPGWLRFQSLGLLDLLARNPFTVTDSGSVEMTDELANTIIRIGGSAYQMGIGGLHSTESKVVHRADDEYSIQDADVASYYPSLILNTEIYPRQIGSQFATTYRGWYESRLSAKHRAEELGIELERGGAVAEIERELAKCKTEADSKKVVLNGSFGKLGSKWSIFYAPSEMIQVTITGQLALLMLIEMLESCGIAVISANTDGVVIKCRRDMEWLRDQCISWWESVTGLIMEYTNYRMIASRDVNSYISVKTDGKVKRKGAYAEAKPQGGGWPNPTGQVCVDAVVAYLAHGTPLRDTVYACNDIRQFVYVRQVKGGGSYLPTAALPKSTTLREMREVLQAGGVPLGIGIKNDTLREIYAKHRERVMRGAEYLGKACRWYYAQGAVGCILTPAGGLVARTEGCRPLMELPDTLPDDLDREWYVAEARSLLADLGLDTSAI